MERNEISSHEAAVWRLFQLNADRWLSSKEIALEAKIAPRTARAHVLKLSQLGVIDVAELFPAHRYRLSSKAIKRNRGYTQRLDAAVCIFYPNKSELK